MTELKFSLNSVRDGSVLQQCPFIVQEMLAGKCSIFSVVLALNESLTHSEPVCRGGGISLLANIFKLLPKGFLEDLELVQMSTFIAERLSDQNILVPAMLSAVSELILMENLPGKSAVELVSHLIQNVSCQQQVVKDRLSYVSILREAVAKYPQDLKTADIQLMEGFIESVDGERDPKCLVMNYRTFVELSQLMPDINVTEDMFEVFAVYFPIDFPAPVDPDRPYTRDNLARLLRSCLLSYRGFAKHLLPLVLEKLNSEFEVAKLDALDVLLSSCNTYLDSDYKPFLEEIAKLLRLEILTGSDSKTCGLSLRVLKKLLETLSESQQELLEIVLNFCINYLKDNVAAKQHYMIMVNVLYMCSLSTKHVCEVVLERIIPIVLKDLTINSITALNILLSGYKTMNARLSDELIMSMIKDLSRVIDENVSHLAISSLTLISTNADFETRNMIYENSLKMISDNMYIAEHYILHLVEMARMCSEEFKTIFIPKLMQDLENNEFGRKRIEILIRLAFVEDCTDYCFEKLVGIVKNPVTFRIALRKLYEVLEVNKENKFSAMVTVVKLLKQYEIIEVIETSFMKNNIVVNGELSSAVSQIIAVLETYLSLESLSKLIEINRCGYWNSKVLAVYTGLICNLPKKCTIPYVKELCECLLESAIGYSVNDRFNANITIYKVVNRSCGDKDLDEILSDMWKKLQPMLQDEESWKYAIETWAWVVKALLSRGNLVYVKWLEEIFNTEPIHGNLTCPLYRILSSECEIFDGNLQILYKQRLFNLTQTHLKGKTSTAENLLVYNLVTDHMTSSVLNLYANEILTVLAESIRVPNENELLLICIYNMKKILELKPDNLINLMIFENMDKFLPKMFEIAQHGERPAQRRVVLVMLNYYARSEKFLSKLLLFQREAIVSLKKCLDDSSREVRYVAQLTLNRWQTLGSES